jgi:hypothetical protein
LTNTPSPTPPTKTGGLSLKGQLTKLWLLVELIVGPLAVVILVYRILNAPVEGSLGVQRTIALAQAKSLSATDITGTKPGRNAAIFAGFLSTLDQRNRFISMYRNLEDVDPGHPYPLADARS